jgi:ABC-type nitrate/sulfonate/bicarbonate transport system ATPase subunit
MPIEVTELSMWADIGPKRHTVLDRLSFCVEDGEFIVLLGPSGCGKSTLLRALAGFEKPSAGAVRKDGVEIIGPDSDRAMVMQQNALFPWMQVIENIEYPLMIEGVAPEERRQRATRWLEEVGLREFWNYYPGQLSIGMQQRVALARLFTGRSGTLLMDEPFGALDTVSRVHSQRLLLQIWERERRTVIFVTHDVEEALLLADRVLVLGGTPTRMLKEHPIQWQRPREFDVIFTEDFMKMRRELLALIGALEP